MSVELDSNQLLALEQLKSGSILCGGVGSGKSRTSLAYFTVKECNSKLDDKKLKNPKPLYIITTAKKRDSKEWEDEFPPFPFDGLSVTIDSWNNIAKYSNVKDSFFIFDEQRLVGSGAWVKAFLKIAKSNTWILLSATPGDTWSDYIPVFIANGFYKNRTEFARRHIVYSRYTSYPKIDRYLETGRLLRLREAILVNMKYVKPTEQHHCQITVSYDRLLYKQVMKDRWDIFKNEPLRDMSSLCYALRRIVNTDKERIEVTKKLINEHPRIIIFYNFDYELEILRDLGHELGISTAEWNGHRHETIPDTASWIYLVQYTAGAEGWNCTSTNAIIFYSQNYSYKIMVQAAGRIDRRNTPYSNLYYYHLRSNASIDVAIYQALARKKNFNERGFKTV